MRVTVAAPAKINLGLRIVGRRDDGYHLLESVFVPLELADELEITLRAGSPVSTGIDIELEVHGSAPDDASNLAVAAASSFFDAMPKPPSGIAGLRLVLRKRIPEAAGLGGGSSDAAAALVGLSHLCPEGPSVSELARIGLSLGADVPFFLDPAPCLVGGIGQEIEPLEGLPELCLLLANPGVALSTAEVYRVYDALAEGSARGLTVAEPGSTMRALFGPDGDSNVLARLPGLHNDLEAAAIRLCPPVARLRDQMHALGARIVGMSGSGATVYGEFATQQEAELAQGSFESAIWTCVTRSRTRSRKIEAGSSE